ncbi:MAG: sigma-70 family RNA polymerase sigma factor [Bacteroidales bacterium]
MDFILLGFVFVHTYIITEEMSLWLTILLHNYTDLIEICVEDINGIIQFEEKFCRQANNNVEQEVLNHELEDEVKKILVSLNPRYSAILIYRFYCEMTYEEIAEELGIDINSVKVNLHRGKKQFKKQLQVNNTLKEYIRGVGMDGKQRGYSYKKMFGLCNKQFARAGCSAGLARFAPIDCGR